MFAKEESPSDLFCLRGNCSSFVVRKSERVGGVERAAGMFCHLLAPLWPGVKESCLHWDAPYALRIDLIIYLLRLEYGVQPSTLEERNEVIKFLVLMPDFLCPKILI